MPIGTALVVAPLALLLAAVVVLVFIRRSPRLSQLTPAVLLSGFAGAVLIACVALTRSTMPISPYESASWADLATPILAALATGFGLGTLIGGAIAILVSLVNGGRARRGPAKPIAP
jgi:hypothetical protein